MTPRDILDLLEQRGVVLRVEAGELRYRATTGAYTRELRALVAEHRAALVEELRGDDRHAAALALLREHFDAVDQLAPWATVAPVLEVRVPEAWAAVTAAEGAASGAAVEYVHGRAPDDYALRAALELAAGAWCRAAETAASLDVLECSECHRTDGGPYVEIAGGAAHPAPYVLCGQCYVGTLHDCEREAARLAAPAPAAPAKGQTP